jgi:geranylgeranyl pyrophosphate synthase
LKRKKEDYINTIEKGFASIASFSAMAGAIITGAKDEEPDMMRNNGKRYSIAFQLSQDLFEL